MIESALGDIPDNHPIRKLFQTLTERGFEQQHLHDEETIRYVSNLLTDFVAANKILRAKSAFRTIGQDCADMSKEARRDYYRSLGDVTLFHLGIYPEHLTYGRHTVSPSFYARQGRMFYQIVAAMEPSRTTAVFRKLSDQFEQCVDGLNWVRLYVHDPFYQYVFREFGVT